MARNYESNYRAIFLYTIVMLNLKSTISKIQNSKGTLFILCGFPYAGKSYVSSQLQQQADIRIVSIDDIFKAKEFDWNTNVLPNSVQWNEIFNESYEAVKESLLRKENVLFDSTNQTLVSRDALRDVAKSVEASSYVIYVRSPIETIWQRWEENQKNQHRPVVSRELVQETIDAFEEPTIDEDSFVVDN